jgi:hypothetical protein
MDIETSTTIVKMADVGLSLPELAEIVRDEIHKCRTAISKALEHAMNAGDALIALQPKVLALGAKWKAWLGENCSIAASTAALYIVLRDRGHAVIASDLVNYGFSLHFVGDFLAQKKAPARTELILTNPLFKIIGPFITRALDLCPRVIVLARLALLESERRTTILEHRGLARVHVFRRRLPFMHRADWNGPRASSAIAFAWFCWSRDHHGPNTIDRISWERP